MSDQQHQEEQVFSTASEPVIEIIEEVQEDGTVIRKKKTTRKITKRVLTTTTSVKEEESERQQQQLQQQQHHQHDIIATFESSESTLKDLSVGSAAIEESIVVGSTTTAANTNTTGTVDITSSTSATAVAATSSETNESDEASEKSSSTTNTTTTTTSTEQSKRTFKYGIFGKGDTDEHPFYKFLARFPLKQSPAPHTRPRPVKPTIYAFAPGWKVGGGSAQETEKQESKDMDVETEKKEKESTVGSFDVDSLKWMTYLKFNQIDYDIKPAFEPTMSPSGKLPFLALPDGSLITEDGFEQWVQENKGQSDEDKASAALNINEAAEALAFSTLAESKIHAALLYTLWFEAPHFHGTTRQHYFGHHNYYLGKLLNYISKSKIVNSMLLTRTQIDRELIFEEAAAALEALSVQLGSNEYFFGKSAPSSLDAIVFSYLHVILTLPRIRNAEDGGRSGELARMVRKHDNLFKYSQNIWKNSFAA